MDIDSKLRALLAGAIPFVMARRKESGGFGATPRLPATIEDTYHALRILQLARRCNAVAETFHAPSGDENLRTYLAAWQKGSMPTGLRTAFQMLWCCRNAGLEPDRDALLEAVIARLQASDSLVIWYYGVRILTEIVGLKSWSIVDTSNLDAVLGRAWGSVHEAWMHIELSWRQKKVLPLPGCQRVAWLQACQNGDGGFGFFPGTTSFVENCLPGLRALASLEAKPRDPVGAFHFLAGCQTISGGFGRSSRAAPFLDATWHALAALAILDGRYSPHPSLVTLETAHG